MRVTRELLDHMAWSLDGRYGYTAGIMGRVAVVYRTDDELCPNKKQWFIDVTSADIDYDNINASPEWTKDDVTLRTDSIWLGNTKREAFIALQAIDKTIDNLPVRGRDDDRRSIYEEAYPDHFGPEYDFRNSPQDDDDNVSESDLIAMEDTL